ncbi:MAG: hypothetical protein GXY83_38535 [Rhodopirellula sp.]|nr:hypothetical protein [Rhodopirellula sp.]
MSQSPAAEALPLKDRSTGLLIFGVLEIFLGLFCVLMVPVMLLSTLIEQPGGAPSASVRMMVPAAVFYAEMATFFIWIGIGSMLARRWARAVMLVVSWGWLVCGVMAMLLMVVLMPRMFAEMPPGQQMPAEMLVLMQIVMGGVLSCVYILLPGALVLFYQSKHVRATCERRDAEVRWTDRCPLAVLALVVLFAYGVSCMVWMPFYNFAMPLFGGFADGVAGAIVAVAIAAVLVYLVWGMYKLRTHAWWTAVVLTIVGSVSGVLTAARTDFLELYRRMGFPPDQIELIKRTGMIEKMNEAWWVGIPVAIVFLAYLLYVKRHFTSGSAEPVATAA